MTGRGKEVLGTLTHREQVVAGLVATGRPYSEVAKLVGTSHQMIKNHCKSLFDKTGTDNRLSFVLFLLDHEII